MRFDELTRLGLQQTFYFLEIQANQALIRETVKIVEDRTITGPLGGRELDAHLATTRYLEVATGKELKIEGEGTLKGGPIDAKLTITHQV